MQSLTIGTNFLLSPMRSTRSHYGPNRAYLSLSLLNTELESKGALANYETPHAIVHVRSTSTNHARVRSQVFVGVAHPFRPICPSPSYLFKMRLKCGNRYLKILNSLKSEKPVKEKRPRHEASGPFRNFQSLGHV